jgi:hypothetical protein
MQDSQGSVRLCSAVDTRVSRHRKIRQALDGIHSRRLNHAQSLLLWRDPWYQGVGGPHLCPGMG